MLVKDEHNWVGIPCLLATVNGHRIDEVYAVILFKLRHKLADIYIVCLCASNDKVKLSLELETTRFLRNTFVKAVDVCCIVVVSFRGW